jgi:glycosyltransferase involved in cell wall biosynthesis
MTNILLISERFYAPWSDGTASYAKGLADTILEATKIRSDLEITVLSSIDRKHADLQETKKQFMFKNDRLHCLYFPTESYPTDLKKFIRKSAQTKNNDVTHILYPGYNPLWTKIVSKRKNLILKHIFIYPGHSRFVADRLTYRVFQKSQVSQLLNLRFVFSSDYLRKIYSLDKAMILPPVIDTNFFSSGVKSFHDNLIFETLTLKFGNLVEVLRKDVVLLYMGPLLGERFNFKTIVDGFMKIRKEYGVNAGLLIIGRELGTDSELYLKEINNYIKNNALNEHVFVCLKNLSENEKMFFFRRTHVFIYPFFRNLRQMNVVSPPIALLESMSAGLCVVTGGLPHLEDLIKDNANGVLVKGSDEISLAKGIWNALINRKTISRNARETIEKAFSIQFTSKLYINFLSLNDV